MSTQHGIARKTCAGQNQGAHGYFYILTVAVNPT